MKSFRHVIMMTVVLLPSVSLQKASAFASCIISQRLPSSSTSSWARQCFRRSSEQGNLHRTVGLTKASLSATIHATSTAADETIIQDMLYRIRQCNNMPKEIQATLLDFQVDGVPLGKVRPVMAERLCSVTSANNLGSVFEMKNDPTDSKFSNPFLTLSTETAGTTLESRTEAVAHVTNELRNQGVIAGWRDELFPVSDSFYNPPVFLIERAAANTLGILEYGVHVNGIVKVDSNVRESSSSSVVVLDPPPLMWMARRSKTKSKYPGMLDHIVAGGQPVGLSLTENVIKECKEEAGIPEDLARPNIHPTGVISYMLYDPKQEKVSRAVLFNYDLYLPQDFVPQPVDGEVEEFFLWTVDELKQSMAPDFADPIKPNCYVVIIDYLLRRGFISPETRGYLDIVRELHSGVCR